MSKLFLQRTNYMYDTVAMLEWMYVMQPTVDPCQPLFTRQYKHQMVPIIRRWYTERFNKQIKYLKSLEEIANAVE